MCSHSDTCRTNYRMRELLFSRWRNTEYFNWHFLVFVGFLLHSKRLSSAGFFWAAWTNYLSTQCVVFVDGLNATLASNEADIIFWRKTAREKLFRCGLNDSNGVWKEDGEISNRWNFQSTQFVQSFLLIHFVRIETFVCFLFGNDLHRCNSNCLRFQFLFRWFSAWLIEKVALLALWLWLWSFLSLFSFSLLDEAWSSNKLNQLHALSSILLQVLLALSR